MDSNQTSDISKGQMTLIDALLRECYKNQVNKTSPFTPRKQPHPPS